MISDDELICEEIDTVITKRAERTFSDVLTEWTDVMLKENRDAQNVETVLLITRIGSLGQRLIFEANKIGMNDIAKQWDS